MIIIKKSEKNLSVLISTAPDTLLVAFQSQLLYFLELYFLSHLHVYKDSIFLSLSPSKQ